MCLAAAPAFPLAGSYCHEMDTAHTRNIEIGAFFDTSPSITQYGSWVSYQTHGLRSYAGNHILKGACRNPHTVSYYFNAHVNYYV